jgi:hypothetical protein
MRLSTVDWGARGEMTERTFQINRRMSRVREAMPTYEYHADNGKEYGSSHLDSQG